MTVTTTDDSLTLYRLRDLNSTVIAHIPVGTEVTLGPREVYEDREWVDAKLGDGSTGYVLGASARSHTTLDAAAKSSSLESAPRLPDTYICPDCNAVIDKPLRPAPGSRAICAKGHRLYVYVPVGLPGFLKTAAMFGIFYAVTYFIPLLSKLGIFSGAGLFFLALFLRLGLAVKGVRFNLKGLVYVRRPMPTKAFGLQMIQRLLGFLCGFYLAGVLVGLLFPPQGWVLELPLLVRVLLQTAGMPQ